MNRFLSKIKNKTLNWFTIHLGWPILPVIRAHSHCYHNIAEVRKSSLCGCFYCISTFSQERIEQTTDEGQTALCPICCMDTVIGSASGFTLSRPFLAEMHRYWLSAQGVLR